MSRTKQTLSVFFFVILTATTILAQSGNQVAKGTPSKTPAPSASNSKSTSPTLVDLNTASKKSLMELPGISDVNAQKIIENRPYHSKTDLTEKKVISLATYEKIAKLIGVKTTTRVSPGNVEKKAAASKGTSEVKKQYQ